MIYKQPSIYKSGFDPKVLKEIEFLKFKRLDKYANNINASLDTTNAISYNKSTNLCCVSTAINITNSFTPVYDVSDGVGTTDWPAIAYCEIDDLNPSSNYSYFTIAVDPVSNNFFSVLFYLQQNNNKVAMCTNKFVALPTNWKNILAVSFFI